MDYFSRKSLSKYLMDEIDVCCRYQWTRYRHFHKWHVVKIRWWHRSTLQNSKVTLISFLTNEKVKSNFTRRLLQQNHPQTWTLGLYEIKLSETRLGMEQLINIDIHWPRQWIVPKIKTSDHSKKPFWLVIVIMVAMFIMGGGRFYMR